MALIAVFTMGPVDSRNGDSNHGSDLHVHALRHPVHSVSPTRKSVAYIGSTHPSLV